MRCEGRESVPSAGLLQRKPWLQKENSEAGTIRCQMPWLAVPSKDEAGGREALRTQSPWRREGKPVLVDRLDFWKRLLSIVLEQEEVAIGGPEGGREGQSGRIRPQLASQMETGGHQMGTGGHQMGQMLYLLGSTFLSGQEECGVGFPSPVMCQRNVGMWVSGKDSLKAFLG